MKDKHSASTAAASQFKGPMPAKRRTGATPNPPANTGGRKSTSKRIK